MIARRLALLCCAAAVSCGGAAAQPVSPATAPTVERELATAEAAERARHHAEARTHYQRAVAVARAPHDVAKARRAYGETLAHWGELPAAVIELEEAVAAVPTDASAWHDLGILRHAAGDGTGAIAALARARDLVPADPRPRIALAALYWRRGDRPAAAGEYRALQALDLPAALRGKVEWALAELAKAPP